MKIRVRCTYFQPIGGYGDWLATCPCGDRLTSPDWEGALTWALGHQSFAHPSGPRCHDCQRPTRFYELELDHWLCPRCSQTRYGDTP